MDYYIRNNLRFSVLRDIEYIMSLQKKLKRTMPGAQRLEWPYSLQQSDKDDNS